MKPVVAAMSMLLVGVTAPRLAAADEPEEAFGKVIAGSFVAGLAASTAVSVYFVTDDLSRDRPMTRTEAAVELGVSELGLAVGVSLFVLGRDQRDSFSESVGGAMMMVTGPTTLHGGWTVLRGRDDSAQDRRRAGMIELAFALPQAAIEGLAINGFANDPVDHVRTAGITTSVALLVPSIAMAAHGGYLIATEDAPDLTALNVRGHRVTLAPMYVGSAATGNLGLGASGSF